MNKETAIPLAVVLALVVAGIAYVYFFIPQSNQAPALPPAAVPDNSVIAGPVTAISTSSISVRKQDGTTATLSITEETSIVMAGEGGESGASKALGDINAGAMVLVTPTQSGMAAQSIVLLPAPPAQN